MKGNNSFSKKSHHDSQAPRTSAWGASYWDSRAHEFVAQENHRYYADVFLGKCNLHPKDVVFDMGCGAGSLAVPFVEAGYTVIAADFSPAMLELLYADMKKRGLSVCSPGEGYQVLSREFFRNQITDFAQVKITSSAASCKTPGRCIPIQLAWDDDWEAMGLRENMVDVAIASRSWATKNYQYAIANLTRLAKRRVCVTVAGQIFPNVNQEVMELIGLACPGPYESDRVTSAARAMGYNPQAELIALTRTEYFESTQQAWEKYLAMIERVASARNYSDHEIKMAQENLKEWLHVHLIESTQQVDLSNGGVEQQQGVSGFVSDSIKKYVIDVPRINRWVFISWDARA